jgi:hypothetical protein
VAEDAWERADVEAILGALWDVKLLLVQLVQLLGGDEEEADD